MSDELNWDPIWSLARRVIEQGEPLELTDHTRDLLYRSAREVAIAERDATDALRSVTTATTLLQEIHRRIGEGSRRLTRAMNQAKRLRQAGDPDGARQQLRDVLAVERVPLYREIAEGELEKLADLA